MQHECQNKKTAILQGFFRVTIKLYGKNCRQNVKVLTSKIDFIGMMGSKQLFQRRHNNEKN